MTSILKKLFFITIVFQLVCSVALAQDAQTEGDLADESLKDFYIVAGMGLGGAILGLSTISFKGDPNIGDNMHRVQTGTAIGIIIGVFVVAANQAERSTKIFGPGDQALNLSPKSFNTAMRTKWHYDSLVAPSVAPTQIATNWSF
jgi:L-aminopeptidase/D-esterase-like protein